MEIPLQKSLTNCHTIVFCVVCDSVEVDARCCPQLLPFVLQPLNFAVLLSALTHIYLILTYYEQIMVLFFWLEQVERAPLLFISVSHYKEKDGGG